MSKPEDRPDRESPGVEGDEPDIDRDAILARRTRFVALAMAGLTGLLGLTKAACSACLSTDTGIPFDSAVEAGTDSGAAPDACLSPPFESGVDSGSDGGTDAGTDGGADGG